MSIYRLKSIFHPSSVAVVGGSQHERSVGRAVFRNLREYRFRGNTAWINPHYAEIDGVATFPRLSDLPWTPELIIITAPAAAVPQIAMEAACQGVSAAIVITAGFGQEPDLIAAQLETAAQTHGLRILGPNCLGVLSPHIGLNASLARHLPEAGGLALVSQSGAIAAGLVEWSVTRKIGFSSIVSLGDSFDVDLGDMLDYFAIDTDTRAILLHIESIHDARKFMSAARAAARLKPVVVIKSGMHACPPPTASTTHMRVLATSDLAYDAAFHRAGLLRVRTLDELFNAAETLSRLHTFPGRRLSILANGGGIGMLAADRLICMGGTLAELSEQTIQRLDEALPLGWSRTNPVDIITDAGGERYATAIEALLNDPQNDALLVINVPTALSSSAAAANALIEAATKPRASLRRKPVFAVWLGNDTDTIDTIETARIPYYPTESDAINGFMHLIRYREAQTALMETPPSLPDDFAMDTVTAHEIVNRAIAQGRQRLDPIEVNRLLAAYSIPTASVTLAATSEEAVHAALPLLRQGATVTIKILSPDIMHKSDVDGVRLNLTSEQIIRKEAEGILQRARMARPNARIDGILVQPTVLRSKSRELIAGIADDEVFGPVIVFGRGGTAVEVIDDKALALPPLDLRLAHELIARTRVSRRLKAYRDIPAADEREVALTLVKLAQLAADVPDIRELDINPLLADHHGVIALDARVLVMPSRELHKGRGHPRFAVLPYPTQWERTVTLADGFQVFVRPVRPEDDAMYRTFFSQVSEEDLRLRFFQAPRYFSHEFIARLTQLDYARSIALAAIDPKSGEMLGSVQLHADADYNEGEYGILVRSDRKGRGLGRTLMKIMIEYAGWLGLCFIKGQVLHENRNMLGICAQLGFSMTTDPDDPSLTLVMLPLQNVKQTFSDRDKT